MDVVIAANLLVVSCLPLGVYLWAILDWTHVSDYTERERLAVTRAVGIFLGSLYLSLLFWAGYATIVAILPD